jgi:molecular chaperone DnaK (HSP70)
MNRTQLAQTIYIETANGQAAPLFVAGYSLPAQRHQPFSTAHDHQSQIDIHLLYGESRIAAQNTTLGRWQISEISPSKQEGQVIDLEILVDEVGTLELRATLEGNPLTVDLLTIFDPRAPVQSVDNIILGSIEQPKEEAPDLPAKSILFDSKSELERLIQQIREQGPGSLNETTLKQLRQYGFDDDKPMPAQGAGFLVDKVFQPLLSWFSRKRPHPRELSPEEIVQLAGEPLAPEDRRICPHCKAVIPRTAEKCQWCGARL